jgi:MFS family permease
MYAGASALCLRMSADLLGPDADAPRPAVSPLGTARALVDAARRIRVDPAVMKALAALTLVRAAFGFWTVLTIVRERTQLHPVSDSDGALAALALATAVGALGAVASALVTPGAVRRLGGRRWVAVLLSVGGAGFLITLPIVSTWAVLGVAALLGFVSQGVKVCVDTVLQRQIGDAWRGRVFAINDLLTNAAFVLAGLLAVPFA